MRRRKRPHTRKVPVTTELENIKLSLQKALLGNVTPNLRAVTVEMEERNKRIIVFFYYDGKIKNETIDAATAIVRKIEHSGYQLHHEIERIDSSKAIPHTGELVYLRNE